MTNKIKLIISIFGGASLGIGFVFPSFSFLAFIGFVPFFYNLSQAKNNWSSVLFFFIGLVVFHVIATYWLYNAYFAGPLFVQLLNPLFYTILYSLTINIFKRYSILTKFSFFILGWLSLEYLHFHWPLSFILLHLGNVLSSYPILIQWYEYTGVLGGSLWILSVNFSIFYLLSHKNVKSFLSFTLILFIPIIFSLCIYYTFKTNFNKPINVALIHPNFDGKTELNKLSDEVRLKRYFTLSKNVLKKSTDILLWPENAIRHPVNIESFISSPIKSKLDSLIENYPSLHLVTGIILYEICQDTMSALRSNNAYTTHLSNGVPIFTYNSIVTISQFKTFQFRSKKKLVPFEETIPYFKFLRYVRNIFPSLGGFIFTHSKTSNDIMTTNNGISFTSIICYESGFGEFIARFSRKGSEIYFIHLNEGWYKNKIGANLFERLAILRSIETRRYIVRSSNYGVSDIISPKGEVLYFYSENKPFSFKTIAYALNKNTIYSIWGDFIGRISVILVLIAIFISIIKEIINYYKVSAVHYQP